jgi:uncharacterized membrane protein YsdA (DUF1294 family)
MNFYNQNLSLIFLAIYVAFNFWSFSLMLLDKNKAERKEQRISEADLFFYSICFGALGVFLGMRFSRHKTKKIKFILGIPLAILENFALIILIYLFVNNFLSK